MDIYIVTVVDAVHVVAREASPSDACESASDPRVPQKPQPRRAASIAAMSIFFICHHRIERALGGGGIGIGDRLRQGDRRDLPGQSPFVLAPAARALLAAVADDRVPVAIRFGLVGGRDLKRERLVVLERGSAVEPEARNAHHGELDGQHVPFLPRRKVARCAVHRADGRIGKGLGVEPRRLLGVAVVPEANRVLCWLRHVTSPLRRFIRAESMMRSQSMCKRLARQSRHRRSTIFIPIRRARPSLPQRPAVINVARSPRFFASTVLANSSPSGRRPLSRHSGIWLRARRRLKAF